MGGRGDGMDGAFGAARDAGTEVEVAAVVAGLGACGTDEGFGHEAAEDVTNANGADAGLLVKGDEAVGHEGTVEGPGGAGVGKAIGEGGQFGAEGVGFSAKA